MSKKRFKVGDEVLVAERDTRDPDIAWCHGVVVDVLKGGYMVKQGVRVWWYIEKSVKPKE